MPTDLTPDQLLTEYQRHRATAALFRDRARALEDQGLEREPGPEHTLARSTLYTLADDALDEAASTASFLLCQMLLTGQLPAELVVDRPQLDATERAVIAGLLAPTDEVNSSGITPDGAVWDSLRAKFPLALFREWAAAGSDRYDAQAGF